MGVVIRWLLPFMLLLGLLPPVQAAPALPNAVMLTMTNPSSCPDGGCAAGQRLNMRADFSLGSYAPSATANVQFCLYAPLNWAAEGFSAANSGYVSGEAYVSSSTCPEAPANYSLLGGVEASLTGTYFSDSLGLAFRIGKTALNSGSLIARVSERALDGTWTTQQSFSWVQVTELAGSVFVANDAATCSINTPCYVNSGDDLPGGLGTGLKDAIDAQVAGGVVQVLGSYVVKSHAVLVDQAITLQGVSDAFIISGGSDCTEPMLQVTAGATVRNLNIQGSAACSSGKRDLLVVNSAEPVLMVSNDFLNGDDAVRVLDNAATVTLRYNHIQGNSGYAVIREAGTGTGALDAIANNFYGNRSGAQVECNTLGRMDHNFWGTGVTTAAAVSQCTVTPGKRLGAAIQRVQSGAGVQAKQVTVTTTRQNFFENKIGLQRADTGSDFDVFIVSHGASGTESIPFTGGSLDDMVPCSNYWDVFLANGALPEGAVSLFVKYDLNAGCLASVESSSYCNQSDPARYPLWWYDPAGNVTMGWDTTGQNPAGSGAGGVSGQVTTCNMTDNEISVQIDSTGRPNLSNDLNFTPFVVGLPSTASGVVFTRFVGIAGDTQATIQWSTSSEVNILGYYLQRSLVPDSGFSTISPYIPRLGAGTGGADYEYLDSGLTNGTPYYYRLQVVNLNLTYTYTGVMMVTPGLPTATPTVTSTATSTATATATETATASPTGTATATITGTLPTATLTATVTGTLPTPTRTRTPTRTPTRTKTLVYIATRTRTLIPTYTKRVASPTSVNRTRTPTASRVTPMPGTPTAPAGGYPGDTTLPVPTALEPGKLPPSGYPGEATRDATLQPTSAEGDGSYPLEGTFTPGPTATGTAEVDEKESPTWLVPLMIVGVGLLGLTGLTVYLGSQGVIPLPFKLPVILGGKKRDEPGEPWSAPGSNDNGETEENDVDDDSTE